MYVITKLRLFTQIHIFMDIIKKVEPRWKISLPIKYYRKHYTSDVLYIFSCYIHSIQFCTCKFFINTSEYEI